MDSSLLMKEEFITFFEVLSERGRLFLGFLRLEGELRVFIVSLEPFDLAISEITLASAESIDDDSEEL